MELNVRRKANVSQNSFFFPFSPPSEIRVYLFCVRVPNHLSLLFCHCVISFSSPFSTIPLFLRPSNSNSPSLSCNWTTIHTAALNCLLIWFSTFSFLSLIFLSFSLCHLLSTYLYFFLRSPSCSLVADAADPPCVVRVNIYVRSISRIDDVTMVSAFIRTKKRMMKWTGWIHY